MAEKLLNALTRIPQDKLLHFVTLQIVALVVLTVLPPGRWTVLLAIILCGMVAVYKELADLEDPHHHAGIGDAIAGMLGGVPLYLLYWFRVIQ